MINIRGKNGIDQLFIVSLYPKGDPFFDDGDLFVGKYFSHPGTPGLPLHQELPSRLGLSLVANLLPLHK